MQLGALAFGRGGGGVAALLAGLFAYHHVKQTERAEPEEMRGRCGYCAASAALRSSGTISLLIHMPILRGRCPCACAMLPLLHIPQTCVLPVGPTLVLAVLTWCGRVGLLGTSGRQHCGAAGSLWSLHVRKAYGAGWVRCGCLAGCCSSVRTPYTPQLH